MSGINFSGLSSGIDFNQLRESLIQIDRQQGLKYITRENDLNEKSQALTDIRTRMTTLATDISALLATGEDDIFSGVKTTSSNTSVFTASANATAPAGVYELKVQKLALSESVISKASAGIGSFTSSYTGSDLDVAIESGVTLLGSLHRRDGGSAFADGDLGEIVVDDGVTGPVTVDLATGGISGSSTTGDMLSYINATLAGAGSVVSASLNAGGNGLQFSSSNGNLSIADGGDGKGTATKFGIATPGMTASPVDGGDLDPGLQLDNTLGALNGGSGVADLASGILLKQGTSSFALSLAGSSTVGDVVSAIGGAGMSITAAISGDGKALSISSLIGNRSLGIIENGGTTASDLGIFGESNVIKVKTASDGDYTSVYMSGAADGVDASLSIADVRSGINALGSSAGFSASVVDGRLSIRSKEVGTANSLEFEDSAVDSGILEQLGILIADPLDSTTVSTAYSGDNTGGGYLQAASDAVFSIDGIVVTRSQNTGIDDVIDGVTLDLLAPSDSTGAGFPADYKAATLTIARDDDAIADALEKMVNQYNSTVDLIAEKTLNDPDGESGVLRTSSFARNLMDGLFSELSSQEPSSLGLDFNSLFELRAEDGGYAFKIGTASSAKIDFDKGAFKEALESDREGVEKMLRRDEDGDGEYDSGVLSRFSDFVDKNTESTFGLIASQLSTYDLAIEQNKADLERFEERVSARDAQLKRQFSATERIISGLQSQSSFLSQQLAKLR